LSSIVGTTLNVLVSWANSPVRTRNPTGISLGLRSQMRNAS
jgi:hypothetical protein